MIHNLFSLSSEEVDKHFGYEVDRIERDLFLSAKNLRPDGNLTNLSHVLHGGNQTWVGLEPQVILTPYDELLLICQHLSPKAGQTMVDLGAGYGRLGLVLHKICPGVKFIGHELVSERVVEGNRIFDRENCEAARLFTTDLTNDEFILPEADFYFIYDYGKVEHIRKTMKQIEVMADKRNIKVIARGLGTRSIIDHEHPWLSQVYPVIREKNFAIYSMSS
jgi:hypothetical protein